MENKPGKVKLDPLIIRDLWSEDVTTVMKAIYRLRSAGSIHYIPELMRLLNHTSAESVEKELIRLLADVKDRAAVPLITDGLKNPDLEAAQANLVSACWQSGLDYSHELKLFIRIFLEGDYRTALESFTVIEESILNLDREEIQDARKILLGGLKKISDEKKPLARELVNLLGN